MIHYPPIEKGIYYGVDFPCKALTNDIGETYCNKEAMKTVNIVLRKYGIYDYIWTHKDFNIERELIKSIGVQVSEEKIKKELNLKFPWWKRLFWTRKRKTLEKAKVVLREIREIYK